MSQEMTNQLRANHADGLHERHNGGRYGTYAERSRGHRLGQGAPKVMTSKFDGYCKRCRASFPKGTEIIWSRDTGAVHADPELCAIERRSYNEWNGFDATERQSQSNIEHPNARYQAPRRPRPRRNWDASHIVPLPEHRDVRHSS